MRALVIAMVLGCTPPPPPAPPKPPPAPAEPSEPTGMPVGYVEMKVWKDLPTEDQFVLLLVDDPPALVLPIFVGGTEGKSIADRMGITPKSPRPLTHTLLESVMHELHGSLVKVQVDELRRDELGAGGVFIGSIFVRTGKRVIKIDARPSDAIALALGAACPIYVARDVLDKAGIDYGEAVKQLAGKTPTPST
jgi:bifunctional DNase/RNase